MATLLVNVFERIGKEARHGDIAEACRRAGVSDQVYINAKKRNTSDELTSAEHKVITNLIGILDERAEDQKKIEQSC